MNLKKKHNYDNNATTQQQQQQQQQQQTNSIIDKLRECKIFKLWFTNLNKIFKKLSLQS